MTNLSTPATPWSAARSPDRVHRPADVARRRSLDGDACFDRGALSGKCPMGASVSGWLRSSGAHPSLVFAFWWLVAFGDDRPTGARVVCCCSSSWIRCCC